VDYAECLWPEFWWTEHIISCVCLTFDGENSPSHEERKAGVMDVLMMYFFFLLGPERYVLLVLLGVFGPFL